MGPRRPGGMARSSVRKVQGLGFRLFCWDLGFRFVGGWV